MRTFSANDYLTIWEQGERLHPIDRALLMLSHASPEIDFDTLARLPLGQRDRLLMEIRQANFGDRIEAHTVCSCGERVEFVLSCSAVLADTQGSQAADEKITFDGEVFALRCPNSFDLAQAVACTEVQAAEEILLARCIEQVPPAATLTPAHRTAIADALSALDPAAEILIDLTCPACGSGSQTLFDINQALWLEIRARALRLLQEVESLARAYHWSETDILGMSDMRRSFYLEMALS